MREFNPDGSLTIGDNYYDAYSLSNNNKFLLIRKVNKSSIYYAEHITTNIKRKISKNGTIQLEGGTVKILDIIGIEFHLNSKEA